MRKTGKIQVRSGKLTDLRQLERAAEQMPDGWHSFELKSRTRRSLPQNAYFHAILPDIMQGLQDAGYYEINTPEKAKQVLKALFFKKEVTNGIETIEVVEDTSATSKEEFSERIEQIIVWAREYLNIDIAPPETQTQFFN